MMRTEDQAAECWCPFSRVLVSTRDVKGTGNRITHDGGLSEQNPKEARCIASMCMAWRWHFAKEDIGYCGMAGE